MKRHGYAAEYRDEATACSDCGTALVAEAPTLKPPPPRPRGGSPLRLIPTLGVPLIVWAFSFIPVPGVNQDALRGLMGYEGSSLETLRQFGIGALGIMPFLTGFVLVELVAVVMPRWSPLRLTPEGRRTLTSSAYRLGAALALLQGWMMAVGLTRMRGLEGWPLVDEPGMAFVVVATLTLAAGACVIAALASLIDRFGYGNGLVILSAMESVHQITRAIAFPWSVGESILRCILVLAITAVMSFATWLYLARGWRSAAGEPALLRPPVAGLTPMIWAASLVVFAATIATFFPHELAMRLVSPLTPGTMLYAGIAIALAIPLTIAGGWLLARPALVVATWSRCLGGKLEDHVARYRAVKRRVTIPGIVIVVGVLLADAFSSSLIFHVPVLTVIVLTAVIADVVADLRAPRGLVPVWPTIRPYAIEPARAMLLAKGIPVHVKNEALYALFPFFAPYAVPVIAVAPAQAQQAEGLLRGALASDEHPDRAALEEVFA